MVHAFEYVIFTIIVGGNVALGLYFSFRRRVGHDGDTDEVFLGKRSLAMFPLAVSVLASMMSALGIVGFTAHYYTYGIHMVWTTLPILLTIPVITTIIVPVFYKLKITSVFEGGLRGVVWTDCVQALVIVAAPATIAIKVLWDASKRHLRPMTFEDFKPYVFQYNLDFTQDENVWSNVIGLFWGWMYRAGLDQVMVQRYLASRTLRDAQRTAWWGTLLIIAYFIITAGLGLIMAYWYRDCDPLLAGVVSTTDQIIPYYVNTNLAAFLGFSGIFLAGVVGATTSTISSIINSLAAVTYVEFVALFAKPSPKRSLLLTKFLEW
nr:sodium-coupled monocarboxylate transporter 1-like [Dermacentor andersoni]